MVALDLSQSLPDDPWAVVSSALQEQRDAILPTSGSTGAPKRVRVSTRALLASADATAERLGGQGQWLAALSAQHIGGLQVWVRSVRSGIRPVHLPAKGGFSSESFAAATARLRTDISCYVALVPTQVHRLLAAEEGLTALARFDRVLIGGAALPAREGVALTEHGVRWTHTYGMTETSGGCIYDGLPLDGVTVRVEGAADDPNYSRPGRLIISGTILATEYVDRPDLNSLAFVTGAGQQRFRTADVGRYDPATGRWSILGRTDRVINTGGHKVHPDAVSAALTTLDAVAAASVVGVADAQWGTRVVAMVVPRSSAEAPADADLLCAPTEWVRAHLRGALASYALPQNVLLTQQLPLGPGGKVNERAVQAAFVQEDDRI